MNYNNSTDAYMRSVAKIGMRQHVRPLDHFDFSGWLVLWKPVGKILMVVFPLVLAVNMFLASSVAKVDRSIVVIEDKRHELILKKIELLEKKTGFWAPESIQKLAGEKLALYEDSGGQVATYSRKKKRFIYSNK